MTRSHHAHRPLRTGPAWALSALTLACLGTLHSAAQAQPAPDAAAEAVMPAVTVTATLSAQDPRTAPASVTVINADEIAARHPADLLDAVRGSPGVTLTPRQLGGRKTLALRGLEGKHTLTLIDGRRISASDDVIGHSDYQYGWLPLSAVERIEVIRGPMSALYGSEALGGVINLIPRQATDRWRGAVGLSGAYPADDGGEGRAGSVSVFAAGPLREGLSLRLSGEAARSGAVADPSDPRQSEIEGRRSVGGSATATLRIDRAQRLEAGFTAADEERHHDDVSSGSIPGAYRSTYDLDRRQAHVSWRGDFTGWRGQLRAYRSEMDVNNTRTNGVTPTRAQSMQDDVLDGYAGTRLGAHRLTAGGEWRRETLVNAGLAGGQDDATHKALFVQDEWTLSDALLLTAGLRHDHHALFGGETSPRAYLVWEANADWVFKGGFGHAFKAPTLKQISPSYVGAEGPHTFLGNAAIKPESANSFELAADGRVGAWQLRATLFRTNVKDLITTRLIRTVSTTPPRRIYQYDNVDRARITGLESGFTWDVTRQLQWSLDLTLLDAEDRRTGLELADRSDVAATSRLQWTAAAGWNTRLELFYTGSQTATGGAALPSYTLLNASVGQRFALDAGRSVQLRAGVDNLGNVRLAEKSPDFGWAERARRVFVTAQVDF